MIPLRFPPIIMMEEERMTRTRRPVAEWEQIFRQHEASGESVKAFCARRGIHPSGA
jgi:hypothetical protein